MRHRVFGVSTRREFVAGGAALGALGALGLSGCTDEQQRAMERASGTPAAGASLNDVGHIVILMQENRSFDHYFGTLSGVRGFSDTGAPGDDAVFAQRGYRPGTGPDPSGYLRPFRLREDPPAQKGQTTNDISHTWTVQHQSWNNGAMDAFVTAHVADDGAANGPLTMGYFTRADLPFYHALADAFTICDGYHCSVLGPTDPNRVMAMSGTIDPAGTGGCPVLSTRVTDRVKHYGQLRWTTMPERLLEAGVSWKVYLEPGRVGAHGAARRLRRERRLLRPRAAGDRPGRDGRGAPHGGAAAVCRGRHRGPDRPRVPHAVPRHLAVQPRRPEVLGTA
jgi:phospholipase C